MKLSKQLIFFKSQNSSRRAASSGKLLPFPPQNINPCLITETAVSKYVAPIGRCWETHPRCFHKYLRALKPFLLTVSLHSWEYPSVQFWVPVRDNPRWKQYMYIYVGILRQASNSQSSKSSISFQGTETHFFHQTTWFLDSFGGYKSVRKQPALKDEMPLRRKGKENKRLLVQPKGTHHCHHRRSTSKPSKAPEKVTLGGRRWGIASRAQVSFCYLRTVPGGR